MIKSALRSNLTPQRYNKHTTTRTQVRVLLSLFILLGAFAMISSPAHAYGTCSLTCPDGSTISCTYIVGTGWCSEDYSTNTVQCGTSVIPSTVDTVRTCPTVVVPTPIATPTPVTPTWHPVHGYPLHPNPSTLGQPWYLPSPVVDALDYLEQWVPWDPSTW